MYTEDLALMPHNGELFRTCRYVLNRSHNEMAHVLGVASKRTVRRWEANQLDIPDAVWDVLYFAVCEMQRSDLAQRILARPKK